MIIYLIGLQICKPLIFVLGKYSKSTSTLIVTGLSDGGITLKLPSHNSIRNTWEKRLKKDLK